MAWTGQTADLPVGWDGLTGTHNMSQVKPTELLVAKNITYENGTLQKEGGATLYGTVPGNPIILAGFDWWPSSVQRMIAVCSDGKIYKDSGLGTFPVTLASGLTTPTVLPIFAEGGQEVAANNKKLFITTGSNQLKVLSGDGATVADVSDPPLDWASAFPTSIFQHNNAMWAFGGADKHRLYYSDVTDHEDFLTGTSGDLSVYPGEGDKISAAISYKGHIIVFKYPKGIYDVNTLDPTDTNWSITRVTRAVGAAGAGCVINIDNDVIFIDRTGNVHQLSSVQEYGDFGFVSLSDQTLMTTFIRENFNLSRLPFLQSILYQAKREIHLAIADISSTTVNTRRLVIDLNSPPKFKWRYSDWNGSDANAIFLRRDSNDIERPALGAASGDVYLADDVLKQDADDNGYEARIKTPHYDLSHVDPALSGRDKIGYFLEIVFEPTGNWDVYVDVYWDGKFSETLIFNVGTSGASLGSFTLDSDVLGVDQILTRRRKLNGSGKRISFELYNTTAGQDFSIAKMTLYFKLGNEKGVG